ncbi:hypothetical protein DAI22_12g159900 [Oryza sativa Japonica Group]|nr:hypothetical protein DAI22_12g159900 [Oryza sativa Japonica Group]
MLMTPWDENVPSVFIAVTFNQLLSLLRALPQQGIVQGGLHTQQSSLTSVSSS